MRIFVAGASGVLGRAFLRDARAAGHAVVGMTRSECGARTIEALGAMPVRADALDAGIISHVVDDGELDAKLADIVATLLAKPPEALRLTQELLRLGSSDEVLERMKLENGHFSERLKSAEVAQAITNFFSRKPAEN